MTYLNAYFIPVGALGPNRIRQRVPLQIYVFLCAFFDWKNAIGGAKFVDTEAGLQDAFAESASIRGAVSD